MTPIRRRACPDPFSSMAAHLAALIDEQARSTLLQAAHDPGRGAAPSDADASGPATLMWVEGPAAQTSPDPDLEPSPGIDAARSIIVAAHRRNETCADQCFIISFPVAAGIPKPQLPTVLRLLKGLGWSLLTRRHTGTAGGCAGVAVLVDTAGPGPERRLWLSEPLPAVRRRTPHAGWAATAPFWTPHKQAVLPTGERA